MYQATKSAPHEGTRKLGSSSRTEPKAPPPQVDFSALSPEATTLGFPVTEVTRPTQERQRGARTDRRGSLVQHLRERKVVQWMLAYLGATWLILQAMDVLSTIWGWPIVVQKTVCLSLALGLLPTLVLAWYHGEKGRQRVTVVELLLLVGLLLGAGTVLWTTGASEWQKTWPEGARMEDSRAADDELGSSSQNRGTADSGLFHSHS